MNPQLLLASYAKKQLSDSGGRKVVDKMFDVSLNRRIVEWSGTDRPEFTDFDGAKVCVEREETNLVLESNDLTKAWWNPLNVSTSISGTFRGLPVTLLEEQDKDGEFKSVSRLSTIYDGDDSNPFWEVYLQPVNNCRYFFLSSIEATGTNDPVNPARSTVVVDLQEVSAMSPNSGTECGLERVEDGWFKIWVRRDTITTENINERKFSLGFLNTIPSTPVDYRYSGFSNRSARIAFASAAINKRYSTNPIYTNGSPVTRLAPTVPIEDALPVTGTVAGVVDMVRDESVNNYIFNTGPGSTILVNRSLLLIRGVNDEIRVDLFGYTRSQALPFPFPLNTRERLAFQITYRSGLLVLTILRAGNIYKLTDSSYSPVDQSRKDIILGSNTSDFASTHFEVPWYKDEIDRTGATDDEIKAFFEFLTLGTSMQMTADEMEIVS